MIGQDALLGCGRCAVVAVCASGVFGLSANTGAFVAPVPEAFVTVVEMTSVPNVLFFQVDQAAANCPANTWIIWNGGAAFPPGTADESGRRANIRNMAQTLLAQKVAGAKVRVHAANKPASGPGSDVCNVEFVHAL